VKEAGRCSWNGMFLGRMPGMKLLSRVIVEFVLVTEEISIERRTTSGPGSPIRRERKLFSSVIDDGAVDIR
jgi:hypothetical protein